MTALIRRSATRTIVALVVLLVAAAAEAGPPLICRPFDAGPNAQLLPWASRGQQWNTPDPSYDIQRLTADTMRLLSADAPILARMENMRRATIYATRDPKVAAGLLVAVLARAAEANARGSRDSLALFDAGYLIESYRQAVHLPDGSRGGGTALASLGSIDGYALVRRSLELGGNNPEMEFAASLMKEGPLSAEHRRRAVSGAPTGSLLAKNLQN